MNSCSFPLNRSSSFNNFLSTLKLFVWFNFSRMKSPFNVLTKQHKSNLVFCNSNTFMVLMIDLNSFCIRMQATFCTGGLSWMSVICYHSLVYIYLIVKQLMLITHLSLLIHKVKAQCTGNHLLLNWRNRLLLSGNEWVDYRKLRLVIS